MVVVALMWMRRGGAGGMVESESSSSRSPVVVVVSLNLRSLVEGKGEVYGGGESGAWRVWLRVERRARKRRVEGSRLGGVGGSIVMCAEWD